MLQKLAVFVEPAALKRLVAGIIGELDFIERRRAAVSDSKLPPAEEFQIDGAKLRIIALLLELRKAADISFELPTSVTEEAFFTRDQADEKPSSDVSRDPWMQFRTAEKGEISL